MYVLHGTIVTTATPVTSAPGSNCGLDPPNSDGSGSNPGWGE